MDEKIGHYRIVEELGRGGMGVVYKAHEESLNRFVAIKLLGEHLGEDEDYVERFMREAQAAAKLTHPNIVQIYFIGEDQGRHYFVMEYVTGRSLQQIVRQDGPMDCRQAADVIAQAASGLAAAHDEGIVHRDIKPANLLLTSGGLVKIADFGLALAPEAVTRLTATGMTIGTPGYLSPEQCMEHDLDNRTDIYSLGVTYFEMLTGALPFQADSPIILLRKIVEAEPRDIQELNPSVDDATRAILTRMMARDRDERFADCHQLNTAIRGYLDGADSAQEATAAMAPPAVAPPLETSPTVILESGEGPPAPPPLDGAAAEPPTAPPPELTVEETPPPAASGQGRRLGLILAAVAALLVVGLAGATAVAWKAGWLGAAWSKVAGSQPAAEASAADSLAQLDSRVGEPRSAAEAESGVSATDEAGASQILEDPGTSEAVAGPASAENGDHTSAAAASGGATRSSGGETAGARVAERSAQVEASDETASTGAADSLAPPVREQSARSSAASARSAASPATSTARRPPPPPARGVVVVAVGEPLLGREVERYLERELGPSVQLVDERSFPSAAAALARGAEGVDVGALMEALQGRASTLVLATVEYLGERQLYYMGRPDVAYQSDVRLTCLDLRTGSPLAPGWEKRVEYTQVQTERTVENNLRTQVPGLRELVRGR